MNIPLDNLYHWVESLVQHPMILYVFRPHGSKDIFDLSQFEDKPAIQYKLSMAPVVICHDQEPLNFDDHKFNFANFSIPIKPIDSSLQWFILEFVRLLICFRCLL